MKETKESFENIVDTVKQMNVLPFTCKKTIKDVDNDPLNNDIIDDRIISNAKLDIIEECQNECEYLSPKNKSSPLAIPQKNKSLYTDLN